MTDSVKRLALRDTCCDLEICDVVICGNEIDKIERSVCSHRPVCPRNPISPNVTCSRLQNVEPYILLWQLRLTVNRLQHEHPQMIRRAVFTLASISILATFVLSSQSPNSSQRNRGVVPHSIENQEALAHFFNALAATRSGRSAPVRIMHFGDSHVAADVLTREIRVRLQQDFGYGGAGLVVPHNPMSTKRRDIDIGASAGWVVESIGGHYSADSIYGPAGIDIATSQAGERAWIVADSDHFELLVGRSPNAGKIDITIDGASRVRASKSFVATTRHNLARLRHLKRNDASP